MQDVIDARMMEVEERELRLNKRQYDLNSLETRQKGLLLLNGADIVIRKLYF